MTTETTPRVWFTSDTHYGHTNIIKYSTRPYDNVEDMNEGLIANHNSRVRPGDYLFHLGDFGYFKNRREALSVFERLNGHKILIEGNHCHEVVCKLPWHSRHFRVFETKIEDSELPVTLAHFPHYYWNRSHHGSFHLHGHCHGGLPFDGVVRRLDVGVDCFGMFPVSWEDVKTKLETVPKPVLDHHGKTPSDPKNYTG